MSKLSVFHGGRKATPLARKYSLTQRRDSKEIYSEYLGEPMKGKGLDFGAEGEFRKTERALWRPWG